MTLISEKFLYCSDNLQEVVAEIIVDSKEDLPRKDDIQNKILHQGSIAYVINSGELYIMNGSGEWCKIEGKS